MHRVVGLANRARLVKLRHAKRLSVEVWQVPTIAGRPIFLGTTDRVDRATNLIFEITSQVLG